MRFRINTVQRGKSVLKYAQINEDYVDNNEKNTTRMVKHLGRVRSEKDIERYRDRDDTQ